MLLMPKARSEVRLTLPWDCLTPDNRRFNQQGHVLTTRYREGKEKIYLLAMIQIRPPRPAFPTEKVQMNLQFFVPDKRKRDPNNLLKGIADALEGVVYTDDKQIDGLSWKKAGLSRQNSRVEITVCLYTP
jgi:Holliday junction resolvase RusA-like endonuclease